ncbi:MAG: DNA cytosine methyltransferase, partial [Pirellulales bacterium]
MVNLKSIELFAGAGGLALGTARAGFRHGVVLERDSDACRTLRLNRSAGVCFARDWDIVEGDVHRYDFIRHCGNVGFIFGGPPCQPFSLGGKHRGKDDHRNLFPEAIRAVRQVEPLAFMFENVKGLLRRTFANYYNYIIHRFRFPSVGLRKGEDWTAHLARLEKLYTSGKTPELSYKVVYRLLNAAEFGAGEGVPQRRERVFIVGIRSDLGVEFSFPPEPTHSYDALLHDKWLTGIYWDRHGVPRRQRPKLPEATRRRIEGLALFNREFLGPPVRTVRDAISDLPCLSIGQQCTTVANHYLNPGARSYPGHCGSPFDEPAKALKAGDHGVPGGENTVRLNDGSVRYFSVRECARLQT